MLITPEYVELNRKLHAEREDYGAGGHRWATTVLDIIRGRSIKTVLDYGCGKCSLQKALRLEVTNYDPAIAGLDAPPGPHDLVVCTDVLEHIEPECIDAVLDDLMRCTGKVAMLVVATRPAKKTLADGRNAHLIQQPIEWWLFRLAERWTPLKLFKAGGEFMFIGNAK